MAEFKIDIVLSEHFYAEDIEKKSITNQIGQTVYYFLEIQSKSREEDPEYLTLS